MQTFLPYENFVDSASVLDRQRLGKQRVEVLQILRTLTGQTQGWANHPAVRMWHTYEGMLILYGEAICSEWIARGYKDSCLDKISEFKKYYNIWNYPKWLGNSEFHLSHQSNLVRKLPSHYRQFFPTVPDNLPYIWPSAKFL